MWSYRQSCDYKGQLNVSEYFIKPCFRSCRQFAVIKRCSCYKSCWSKACFKGPIKLLLPNTDLIKESRCGIRPIGLPMIYIIKKVYLPFLVDFTTCTEMIPIKYINSNILLTHYPIVAIMDDIEIHVNKIKKIPLWCWHGYLFFSQRWWCFKIIFVATWYKYIINWMMMINMSHIRI